MISRLQWLSLIALVVFLCASGRVHAQINIEVDCDAILDAVMGVTDFTIGD